MKQRTKPDFERYMAALRCEEPDRVPLGEFGVDPSLKEKFMGRKVVTLQDNVDFALMAGFDFAVIRHGSFQFFGNSGGTDSRKNGAKNTSSTKGTRNWADEHAGLITNWEQFEKYSWPSPADVSTWDTYGQMFPSGMKAIVSIGKIYTAVWMLMGAEPFFNALETQEELIAAMFEKVGQIQFDSFLKAVEFPYVGAFFNADDIAHNTGLLINPKYLRKYLFPWYKKMGDICNDRGLGFIFHSDGDCTEIMDDLVDCGYHGFNPVQPNCMDIVEVKKKWGDSLCLIGNINLDSTLTLGTPEDVRAEVYERIRTIGPGGGYMVASSNSIPDYVPFANMKAMFDATFEFGGYPIDLPEGGVTGKIWTFKRKPRMKKTESVEGLDVDGYAKALLSNDQTVAIERVKTDIESGSNALEVISKGMIPAMTRIGEQFQRGEIYIPEMMIAAGTMKKILSHFKDQLTGENSQEIGKIVFGTVIGDMHDIGKNLVIMMLEGQGYRVEDLGVSVSPEDFVQALKKHKPDILALSALLTTTMVQMKNTINTLEKAGIRDSVKIIVGGAPLTQAFADEIHADGYAYDAPGAAQKCNELLGIK